MKQALKINAGGEVSEMAIVDTFTKLIFGQESEYSGRELRIIQTLRRVDDNVSLDSHLDMGTYLRALGVKEMIGLVSRVQSGVTEGIDLDEAGQMASARDSRPPILPNSH